MIREARRKVALWLLPKPEPTMVEKLILAGDILREDRRTRVLANMGGETLSELARRVLGSTSELEDGQLKGSVIDELCRRAYPREPTFPGRSAHLKPRMKGSKK